MTRVLITGGAGFIGSHTSDLLLEAGYQVRLLDNLTPQVHGPARERPAYLQPDVDLRSEEHTSELQSRSDLVCRLLLEKKKRDNNDVMCATLLAVFDVCTAYASLH